MVVEEKDKRFYIKRSGLRRAGMGLFAKIPLAQGATLKVLGVWIKPGSVSDRCTRYADTHKFHVGRRLLIPLGYAGIVNHSAKPNLEKIILKNRQICLRTLRPIKKNEELFSTYHAYAQLRFGFGIGAKPAINNPSLA